MRNETKIEELIIPIIDNLGYEVVRVALIGSVNPTLQIMIDNKNEKPIIIEDCVAVSKTISDILDENIDYQYNLEVSSPGIDRPLTKPKHFERFIGFDAKIDTLAEVERRKRFKGKILGVNGQNITIETDGSEYVVGFDNIMKAKLVLTDELLKAYEQECEDETNI
ncbi:MAG: ribosome maturation factor RimP [Lactobacillaceae bacterium]|jgi:ribosome maturation factor RimP|nr:ribosome maturation factor RimP [Lactobacillaceae bacterium]